MIFPVEVRLHKDPSRVYDCVSWDPDKRLYKLVNDDGDTVFVDYRQFTPISQIGEGFLEASSDGHILELTEGQGRAAGPGTGSPTRKPRKAKDDPRTATDDAIARVRELLAPCGGRDEIAKTASGILPESHKELLSKYAHLDNGRFRMVIGNRIRTAFKKKHGNT